ncbi:hypothetical protein [Cupriavidus numazuensis]|uniref:Uncharacterized protein n=1 Tax=Cupriavidus numazuensis TaxID=221992 RepID=A0ABN7QCA9_9BURK|nr:hypothetical protein [Cupriavidus numazuensis]CAG2161349.1 hypothetical protein LMG26411_08174 [Cupriavidus numazuensis]
MIHELVVEDVVEVHSWYREWALSGQEDEYLEGALLDELKVRLTSFLHLDGDLTSLKIAKGGSGLELTLRRKT